MVGESVSSCPNPTSPPMLTMRKASRNSLKSICPSLLRSRLCAMSVMCDWGMEMLACLLRMPQASSNSVMEMKPELSLSKMRKMVSRVSLWRYSISVNDTAPCTQGSRTRRAVRSACLATLRTFINTITNTTTTTTTIPAIEQRQETLLGGAGESRNLREHHHHHHHHYHHHHNHHHHHHHHHPHYHHHYHPQNDANRAKARLKLLWGADDSGEQKNEYDHHHHRHGY